MSNNIYPFRGSGSGSPVNPGGGGGGGVEARLAKLEAHVEHIQSDIGGIRTDVRAVRDKQELDFRLLFGALIAVALGLAAIIAKGFGWI